MNVGRWSGFAYVGSGDFAAFDFAGKELWKFDAQERYGKFSYGFGMHTPPLLHEGRVYLQLIHAKAALVVALDAATGQEIWKVDRPSDGHCECLHSYASPALWKNGGEARLITHGNDYAIAHNLANGAEVWRVASGRERFLSARPSTGTPAGCLRVGRFSGGHPRSLDDPPATGFDASGIAPRKVCHELALRGGPPLRRPGQTDRRNGEPGGECARGRDGGAGVGFHPDQAIPG
jgi:hypothetical protein